MNKFFVYYDKGSCNYQDHEVGLIPFGTIKEAEAYIKEKCPCAGENGSDESFAIIYGYEVDSAQRS